MHSLAGIMDRKADCVQSMACLFTISALHVPVDVYIFRYRPAHEAFVDREIPYHTEKGPLIATARPFT